MPFFSRCFLFARVAVGLIIIIVNDCQRNLYPKTDRFVLPGWYLVKACKSVIQVQPLLVFDIGQKTFEI